MQNLAYIAIYNEFNIFCSVLLLIIYFSVKRLLGNSMKGRPFCAALLSLVVFMLSDTIWYSMDQGLLPKFVWISFLFKSSYFVSATFAGYFWFIFFESSDNPAILEKNNSLNYSLLVITHVVLAFINIPTGILFTIDEDLTYTRGKFFIVQFIIIYCYFLYSSIRTLYRLIKNKKKSETSRYLSQLFFPLLPAISGLLQYYFRRIPINCIGFSLAAMILYHGMLKLLISIEPLSGLTNRRTFIINADAALREYNPSMHYFLFMIDIDDFKHVNDTFGHLAGDNAIVDVSDVLKKVAHTVSGNYYVGRYGGDEFIILLVSKDPSADLKLKNAINTEIDALNLVPERICKLSLSIGCAEYRPVEVPTITQLIDNADKRLYIEKNFKHKK